jgi:hypothetical protein
MFESSSSYMLHGLCKSDSLACATIWVGICKFGLTMVYIVGNMVSLMFVHLQLCTLMDIEHVVHVLHFTWDQS